MRLCAHPQPRALQPSVIVSAPCACLQYTSALIKDWRVGAFVAMLLLPNGLHTMLASATLYCSIVGAVLTLEARYPGIESGSFQHAALPLTWQGLVRSARQQRLQTLLPALAQAVLLPVLVNYALRWLQCQQQRPQRQAAAAQHASGSGGSRGGAATSSNMKHDGQKAGCPTAAGSRSPSRSSSSSSHRSGCSSGIDRSSLLVAGPSLALHSHDVGREDDVSRQDQDRAELPPSSAQPESRSLYRSPIGSGESLLMHLKLVGADAAAEAAFVQQLPDALASVLGDAEAAAAAWQLLHVSTFSGAWGAAA